MVGSDTLVVSLVPRSLWAQLIARDWGRLTADQRAMAVAILRALHGKHVGITPQLARQLAPLLLGRPPHGPRDAENGPWFTVLRRLFRELVPPAVGRTRADSSERGQHWPITLGAAPSYSLIHLVSPLVVQGCRNIGRCCLFGGDDQEGTVSEEEYLEYAQLLAAEIDALARSDQSTRGAGSQKDLPLADAPLAAFWRERALTLASLYRGMTDASCQERFLPDVDPLAAAAFLRLRPVLPPNQKWQERQRSSPPILHRRSRRRFDGGWDGIHLTLREEELSHMLVSEYLYPPAIRFEHMANEGFAALQHEPRQERMRDVLIVAIIPWEVRAHASADFAKACWFDCQMRLSLVLQQHGLLRSEFRIIEEDSLGGIRTVSLLLQDLPEATPVTSPGERYRLVFLSAMRWLPAYLDRRPTLSVGGYPKEPGAPPQAATPRALRGSSNIVDFAAYAWNLQMENTHWRLPVDPMRPGAASPAGRLSDEDFAYIHVTLFRAPLSLQGRRDRSIEELGRLRSALKFGDTMGHHVSITSVPGRIEDLGEWSLTAIPRRSPSIWPGTPPAALDEPTLAGHLVNAWLDQIVEEMWRG